MKEEFPLVAGPKVTKLVTTYDPAHDNIIVVESIDSIPKPPNHITIFDLDEHYTTVSYDFVGNNKLSGLKVIEGDSTHVYKIGDYVVRTIDKYDFEAILAHIKYLETHKLDRFQGKCKSGQVMAVDGDGYIKPQELESLNTQWGGITGNIERQEDLMEKLDDKVNVKQGIAKRGKILKVDSYGSVDADNINWGEIGGTISQQSDLVTQLDLKVNAQYPITEAGKALKVGSDGKVTPSVVDASVWGGIQGNIDNQTDLKAKLDSKVDTNQGTGNIGKVMKVDGTGSLRAETIAEGIWGQIAGTIDNQTDLMSKINAKVDIAQSVADVGKVMTVGTDGNLKPQSPISGTWGTISGNIEDQDDLVDKFAEKIDVQQSTAFAGRVMKVDLDGKVRPLENTVAWGDITGSITSQSDLSTELDKKINKSTTSVPCSFGVDSTGKIYVEY